MKVTYLGICDLASITREGKVNLLGIFRQIFVQKLPTNYLKFTIVAMVIGKENSQQEVTLQIISPDKKPVVNQQLRIQIGPAGSANMFFDVVNLPIQLTGDFQIQLISANQSMGETTFNVLKVKPQEKPQIIN